jgi:3-hydroxyacyl-CoA dehydrogenase
LRFHDAVGKLASALPGGEFAGEANQESCMSAGSEFEQAPPSPPIQKAGVLGAGTMGARIAAHLANAGLAVVLLDIPSDGTARSAVAARGLDSLRKAKPAAFYDAGGLATLLWVIEAVTENLAIKQEPARKGGAAFEARRDLSVPIPAGCRWRQMRRRAAGGASRALAGDALFQSAALHAAGGDHSPRRMPIPRRSPRHHFADVRLGKEVVFARDTPNFIANRIGVFIMLEAVRLMQAEDLTIEEVDVLTGTAIGWPRTGTFRLADLVGMDVLAHVAPTSPAPTRGANVPPFFRTMLERRWLAIRPGRASTRRKGRRRQGDPAGAGLEDARISAGGPAKIPSLEMAKNSERCRAPAATAGRRRVKKDKAARFHWRLLSALWNYAADCLPEIADDVASVDRAMKAGFNWEMGPFQLWDAAGVRANRGAHEARASR